MKRLVVILHRTVQTGIEEWSTYYHSKPFPMTATLQEIEDWAKTIATDVTIFDLRLSKMEEENDKDEH